MASRIKELETQLAKLERSIERHRDLVRRMDLDRDTVTLRVSLEVQASGNATLFVIAPSALSEQQLCEFMMSALRSVTDIAPGPAPDEETAPR